MVISGSTLLDLALAATACYACKMHHSTVQQRSQYSGQVALDSSTLARVEILNDDRPMSAAGVNVFGG